ncbi:MAG: hypothetical protein MJZ30_09320 [Paludibacteraceae bacterium]|nr:hypothetical protein [Paludibacteraceae bacterium]
METKTTTVRVTTAFYDAVVKRGTFNSQIVEMCEAYMTEEKIRMLDIKGIFEENEWKALCDSFNGTILEQYRYNKDMLIMHCEDAETLDGIFSKWGCDVNRTNGKINSLTRIQVSSVIKRIEEFWEKNLNLEEWSKF